MSRLMSVRHTEPQVVARPGSPHVGVDWHRDKHDRLLLKPGDHLTLCRQVMGRPPGAPLVRLAEVEVVDVARAQLRIQFTDHDAADEGFPDWEWEDFVAFYCNTFKVEPTTVITYIRWRYLDDLVVV